MTRKRNLSGMVDKKRSGPAVTHGGFSDVKKYREGKKDMRRKDDKALALWKKGIVDDLGGVASLDMLQSSCLDRATELLIILRSMSLHVQKEGIMADDGNVAPCLRTSYIAYSNSFRRLLESIYERADKKPPKKISLDDYIKGSNSE